MLEIEEKDIIFGHVIKTIVTQCPTAETVFSKESWEQFLECEISTYNETRGKIYSGLCPIHRLLKDLDSSPFLELWRDFYNQIELNQKKVFSTISLIGIGVLYSVNNQRIPRFFRNSIESLVSEFEKSPDGYPLWSFFKNLEKLNPFWLNELYLLGVDFGITLANWRRILVLLGIFLEGMKPIEPLNKRDKEQLLKEITEFLSLGR